MPWWGWLLVGLVGGGVIVWIVVIAWVLSQDWFKF